MTEEKKILTAVKNIPVEQIKQLPYFKNRGNKFVSRALIDDESGRKELAFSNAIKDFHELHGSGLAQVIGSIEDRDVEVALTLFQWLGTNLGGSVLDDALKMAGKVIVTLEKEPDPTEGFEKLTGVGQIKKGAKLLINEELSCTASAINFPNSPHEVIATNTGLRFCSLRGANANSWEKTVWFKNAERSK